MHKIVRRGLRYCYYALAVLIVITAISLQALRLLAPQIDKFRPSIEQFLREEINAQVTNAKVVLGGLDARWYGLRPHVFVSDLAIIDEQEETLLRIAQADFAVDLLSSAIHRQWVWKKVTFNDMYLDVKQANDGRWQLAGLELTNSNESSWRYRSPITLFESVPQVDVNNVQLQFTFSNAYVLNTFIPKIKVENSDDFHRLTALANIDDEEVFSFIMERQQGSESIVGYERAQLMLKQFPLDEVIAGVLSDNQVVLPLGVSATSQNIDDPLQNVLPRSLVDASLWFDFSADTALNLVGELSMNRIPAIGLLERYPIDKAVTANVVGGFTDIDGWFLGLRDVLIGDEALPAEMLLKQQIDQSDNVWRLALNTVDVTSVLGWAKKHFSAFIANSDNKQIQALNTLQAEGVLQNMMLQWSPENEHTPVFSAQLNDVSISPINNIPGFDNINGYLETSAHQGFLDLSSSDFGFFPSKTYDQAITFTQVDSQIAWRLEPEKNRIVINSNHIRGQLDKGAVNGYFYVDIPWQRSSRTGELILQIGLEDSTAKHYQQLLPKNVPVDVKSWLSSSITEGDITQAGFIYRGGFSGQENTLSYQFFLNIDNASVAYSPDWPELSKVAGRVLMDNRYVEALIDQASMLGEPIDKLQVTWPGNDRQELNVKVDSRFTAASALRVVNESELRNTVGSTFDTWSAKGSLNVHVDVDIPLGQTSSSGEISGNVNKAKQLVDVTFVDNQLTLNDQQLNLTGVNGRFSYSDDKGVFSENLSAVLFDKPVSLQISQKSADKQYPSEHVQLVAKGSADVSSLADWTSLPELAVFNGAVPYQMRLQVPFDRSKVAHDVKVIVTSDLLGVSNNLPEPFFKVASDKSVFSLEGVIDNKKTTYHIALDDDVRAQVIDDGGQYSGFLQFSDNKKISDLVSSSMPKTAAKDVFSIVGDFNELSLEQWLDVFSQEALLSRDRSSYSSENSTSFSLNYDISANRLLVEELIFSNVTIVGDQEKSQWRVAVNADNLKGTFQVDDTFSRPVEIALEYLHIPESAEEISGDEVGDREPEQVVDILQGVDLSWLKPTTVTINQLSYKNVDMGDWRFALNPILGGFRINELYANFSQLSLHGGSTESGASLVWVDGAETSRNDNQESSSLTQFSGVLEGKDIKHLFTDWGFDPLLTSNTTRFDANISWPGSPLFFSMERLQGSMKVDMDDGVFVQSTGKASSGVLRLFGLFNFDTWARRLRLDFSDIYKKGIVFDRMQTQLRFNNGFIYFQDPLYVTSPSSEFTMAGLIDYPKENIDAVLVTTLPVGGNLTFAAGLIAGLPAAVGIYLASKIFKSQVKKVSSLTYSIKGDWAKPEVKFIDLFNNKLSGK